MYFAGEYTHTLDGKNRVVIPAKFRLFLQPEEKRGFFVTVDTSGKERCIRLYPKSSWEKLVISVTEQAAKYPDLNNVLRLFYSHSDFATNDNQYRLVIPQKLIEYANLTDSKEVIIVGLGDHIEIWNKEEWETNIKTLKSQSISTKKG